MATFEDEMAKWGEQFLFPRPNSFEEQAAIERSFQVVEEHVSLEANPFEVAPRISVRARAGRKSCPSVVLVCDSAAATREKCGYSPITDLFGGSYLHASAPCTPYGEWMDNASFDTPADANKRYLNYSIRLGGCTDDFDSGGCATAGSISATFTVDSVACTSSGDPSGSLTITCPESNPDCDPSYNDGDCNVGDEFHYEPPGRLDVVADVTLSDEYTTAILGSNTVAGIPAYPDTFAGSCGAFLHISEDELACAAQNFRYKFTFPSTAGYLKIWWTERSFDGGGAVIGDVPMEWEHLAGTTVTESDVYELLAPATPGDVGPVNIRWATNPECTPSLPIGSDCNPDLENCSNVYRNCCL